MCFYYKYLLPLKVVDVPSIMYRLEVKIGDKTCNFASLIRSPSQTKDEFENCIQNLEVHLEHISKKSLFLIVLVRNFNARMQFLYQNDTTTFKIDMVN